LELADEVHSFFDGSRSKAFQSEKAKKKERKRMEKEEKKEKKREEMEGRRGERVLLAKNLRQQGWTS